MSKHKINQLSALAAQKYISYLMRNISESGEFDPKFFLIKDHKIIYESLCYWKKEKLENFNLHDFSIICIENGYSADGAYNDLKLIHDSFEDSYNDNIKFIKGKVKDFKIRQYINTEFVKGLLEETDKKEELISIPKLEILRDKLNTSISDLKDSEKYLYTAEDLALEHKAKMEKMDKGEVPKRIIGYNCIDKLFGGYTLDSGEFSIFAGLTGSAKSIFVKNIELNLAHRNIPVLSLNPEMTSSRTSDRIICIQSGLEICDILDSNRSDENKRRISNSYRKLINTKSHIFSFKRGITLSDFENFVITSKKKFFKNGIIKNKNDYIVVTMDLLTMLAELSGEDWKQREKIIDKIHEMSSPDNLNFHLIGVLQAGDDIFENGKKMFKDPTDLDYFKIDLSMIRGGQIFRERARAVFTMTRPLHMKKRFFPDRMAEWEMEKRDLINLHLTKTNNSETGFWQFTFDSNFRVRQFEGNPN